MKHAFLSSRLPALVLATGWLAVAAPAGAQATNPTPSPSQAGEEPDNKRVTTFADLVASAGYASNPLFRSGSSVFGRLSVSAFHGWNTERGSTALTAFVEDTTYVRGRYGSKQIFRLNAQANRAVSEKLSVYGNLGITGDIAGQLSNRITAPPGVPPPEVIPPDTTPEVINLSGRQYYVNGTAGASIVTSPLSSVSLTAGASHAFFTGDDSLSDYSTYQIGFGYSRKVSERTQIGAMINVQRQDYRGSDYSNVINPVVTFSTQLAEDVSATGSVGLLAIYRHRDGQSDHAYSPSLQASICKRGERTNLCANLSRTASAPLAIRGAQNAGTTAITTRFSLAYNRKLGERDSMQAVVTATRSSRASSIDTGQFRTTYMTGLLSYDRKVGNRLFAGVSGGARKVFQTGPDPRMDYNANLFLRYRLGDLL